MYQFTVANAIKLHKVSMQGQRDSGESTKVKQGQLKSTEWRKNGEQSQQWVRFGSRSRHGHSSSHTVGK